MVRKWDEYWEHEGRIVFRTKSNHSGQTTVVNLEMVLGGDNVSLISGWIQGY